MTMFSACQRAKLAGYALALAAIPIFLMQFMSISAASADCDDDTEDCEVVYIRFSEADLWMYERFLSPDPKQSYVEYFPERVVVR